MLKFKIMLKFKKSLNKSDDILNLYINIQENNWKITNLYICNNKKISNFFFYDLHI